MLAVSGNSSAVQVVRHLFEPYCTWITVPGGLGAASRTGMVADLLNGLHIATAAEAMGLAGKAGVDPRSAYEIIVNAAGSSSAFASSVPAMLDGDWTCRRPLSANRLAIQVATAVARSLHFPLPLASAAEQVYVSAVARGYGDDDEAGLLRAYLPSTLERKNESNCSILTPSSSPVEMTKIGVIGLGAMGYGMASSLVRAGYDVWGYDVSAVAVERFASANGPNAHAVQSPEDAVRGANVVLLMVQNAAQAEQVLFSGAVDVLRDGAVVILSSTVPPKFVRGLGAKLTELGKGVSLVDAPVSGGVARAAKGSLTIICSGDVGPISKVNKVLLAMTGSTANLYVVDGGIGAATSVKLVNQLLAGVHIAAVAEALSLAARLRLDTRAVFDVLKSSNAWSWMLENRAPQMLAADWTPHSALAIFVKDLGIVLEEASRLDCWTPLASIAHTLYLSGAARQWSKESDAGVVRLWEMAGVSVASQAMPRRLPAQETLDALPSEYTGDALASIRRVVDSGEVPALVVLDDDPTGTQTCHDIDVLTVWNPDILDTEFRLQPSGFFILTNSRALPSAEARQLIQEICKNVSAAAQRAKRAFEIVLRGDSTLRGHLPDEPEAAEAALGQFDGWVIAPFFAQGGRLTIGDVHYVKEGHELVPVSQTPFAQDATFGYRNSNLRHYVLEKCGRSRFDESSFLSVTLDEIRRGGPSAVTAKLLSVPADPNRAIIVNAAAESDMHVFVAGLLEAERGGRRYLYRTGAAFVSSRFGIQSIPPLTIRDLGVESSTAGGLIVAGSYVPKTTAQLQTLRNRRGDALHVLELDVPALLKSDGAMVDSAAVDVSRAIASGKDTLVMTSRSLVKGHDGASSLDIGGRVAQALVRLIEKVEVRPRYIIAKGGITSSDGATKGLRMRRARVVGQAAPGVPLWRCDEETSRHRGVPYVVFPGNVGTDDTLADVVAAWERPQA